jgi:prepilin-type N-terminal cleavage/methylation domain-containing protein/prepilin-type processing-associated H-X9-DG protein
MSGAEMRARRAFTLVELLVVMAIISILVGILLPAVQQVRESARRAQCQNNLRQLGLALLNFHDGHGVFPASGWTTVGPGNPLGKYVGWRALTLPYIEQGSLQELYNFRLHWWERTNPTAGGVPVRTFQCPSSPGESDVFSAVAKPPRPAMTFPVPLAPTDYEAIMGVKPESIDPKRYNSGNRFSVMYRNSCVRMADVRDGTSSTIMVVECAARPHTYRVRSNMPDIRNDQGIGWVDSEGPFSLDGSNADGSREGCTPANGCQYAMNRRNDNEPYSFHFDSCNFLFADGHVQSIHQDIELLTMAALCTRSASEVVVLPD